jgi:hypothetical protein
MVGTPHSGGQVAAMFDTPWSGHVIADGCQVTVLEDGCGAFSDEILCASIERLCGIAKIATVAARLG